jgi:hypothetical protein
MAGEARVHEQAFLLGNGVDPDHRVDGYQQVVLDPLGQGTVALGAGTARAVPALAQLSTSCADSLQAALPGELGDLVCLDLVQPGVAA